MGENMKKVLKSLFALTLCVCACTMFACKEKDIEEEKYDPITVVAVDYTNDSAMQNGSYNLYLSDNNSYTFNFEMEPKEASWKDLDITISNKNVISLNNNTVTGKQVGLSTITFKAKKGDFNKSVTFNVTDPDFSSYGNYYNVDELGARLSAGNDVRLLKDITATSGMFTFSKSLTIDLNGHNINMGSSTITLESTDDSVPTIKFNNSTDAVSKIYGTTTLLFSKSNVTANNISFETTSKSTTAYAIKNFNNLQLNNCQVKGMNGIESSSNLTLTNTLVEAQKLGLHVAGSTSVATMTGNSQITSSSQGVVVAGDDAKFVMSNGSITADKEAVTGEDNNKMNIELKSGTITSKNAVAVYVANLGNSYIGCYQNGSSDIVTNDLNVTGKPAIKVLQGNVKVGAPSIADTNNQIEILTNSVAGQLSFKFLTSTSLTAKITTAMKEDKSDVKVAQKVDIDRTYGNFQFETADFKFASTQLTFNANGDEALTIAPIAPIFFDGTIVYEFNNDDNFQFKALDGQLITPERTTEESATKDSKIVLTNSNGFLLARSAGGTSNMPETFEIIATYKPSNGTPTSIILTITINTSAQSTNA